MPRTILITGANRGIGLALTREYLTRGQAVYAACRRVDEAFELTKLAQHPHGQLNIVELDVADDASPVRAAQTISRRTAAIDILINNAGRGDLKDGSLEALDPSAMLGLLNVNTVGPLRVTKAMLPLLQKSAGAKVVNISSGLGGIGGISSCQSLAYGPSKAALNHLTRSLAFELRPRNIIVAAVSPGWVRTDMGGPNAPLSPEESAAGLARVIDRLAMADTSAWFNHDGTRNETW